ncbi:hypothetical protein M3194_05325 [Paenibacillus glycanilyticus]|uniref:hypothetical protein n=1 Tax=Paenibacillus glycanilyticus TaxID=126569 RepID=UPI00203A835A|nr:hypothetical protein [Paenibacillus glycanilyticus]MCM3626779.1 hypothetical protein [Paenibacillus glycanilyticus]
MSELNVDRNEELYRGDSITMKLIFNKSINFRVLTYEKLADKGELIYAIIKELLDTFLKPHDLEITFDIQNKYLNWKKFKLNDKNLEKVYSLLVKGETLSIYMRDKIKDNDRIIEVMPLISLGISCFDAEPIPEGGEIKRYNELTFLLSEKLFQGNIPLEIQNQITSVFKNIVSILNAVTGSISFDTSVVAPNSSSYLERYYDIHPYHYSNFNDKLRGYFWANWLSSSHIEHLGGRDYVLNYSPCYKTDFITVNGQIGAYIQLTSDINFYDDESLIALRMFLLPVLYFGHQARKNDTFYLGEVHKLVES